MDEPRSSKNQQLSNFGFKARFTKQWNKNRNLILYGGTFFIALIAIFLPMHPALWAKITLIVIAFVLGILGLLLMVDKGGKLPRALDPIRKPANFLIAVYALGSAFWAAIEAYLK